MDVKTTCLGVLMLGEASGYEIKKHFEEGPFSHFHSAGFGSIYPALNKLLGEGLVTCTRVEQTGKPDKKVYAITDTGRAAFTAALSIQPEPDQLISDTCFRFFFAEIMEQKSLRASFDAYQQYYRTRANHLASMSDEGFTGGRLFVRGLAQAFYGTIADYLDEHEDELMRASEGDGPNIGDGPNTGKVILEAIEALQSKKPGASTERYVDGAKETKS